MAGVDLYPAEPRIHGPDVCKDAVEATPRINLVVSNPPNTLFEKSMRVFGFNTCASYKNALDTLKKGILTSIPGYVIQLPINRLKRTFVSLDIPPKTLPSNIKGAFYDSGPSPQSYKDDIIQYNTLASFTDPGPSSYIPGIISYPLQGEPLIFPDDTFIKMFPNSSILIKDFRGILNAAAPFARLSFNIYQKTVPDTPTHRIVVEFSNSNNLDGSYNVTINGVEHPDLKCFHGNPTKNAFFNTNSIRGGEQDKILYGVLYIFCKEFCGDILIGLIAKHYDNLRKTNPALPDYALVTGDGTLEAYACFLQVNHVAKNHSRAGLEEAIVRIFAPPTEDQLRVIAIEEKTKALDKIIEWNALISNACIHLSTGTVSIRNIDQVTLPIKKLFAAFSAYITNINTYLTHLKVSGVVGGVEDNTVSVSEFMTKYKSYEVKNVFKNVTMDEAVLMRGIYDPFKYVPQIPSIDRAGFPVINKEFLNYLMSIKLNKSGGGKLEEDLHIGDNSFEPLEANTDEYLNKYLKDPTSLINTDPTLFLKQILGSILAKNSIKPDILDVEDVYNFIFTIYDKECKISYNEDVIWGLIIFLLNGKCLTENEFDFYNTLLATASATYTHPPEHIIPMPNAPAPHVPEPWPFPPLAPANDKINKPLITPPPEPIGKPPLAPELNLNKLALLLNKQFGPFGSAPKGTAPVIGVPAEEPYVAPKGKRKANNAEGLRKGQRIRYDNGRIVYVEEMNTGGHRKTTRRKKRHTKKRTHHSSKTRRAKRRKTHKK